MIATIIRRTREWYQRVDRLLVGAFRLHEVRLPGTERSLRYNGREP